MKECWYGDKRDLVKWGALIQLARAEKIDKIIQVAFFREEVERHSLQLDDEEFPIASEVWSHFRSLHNVKALEDSMGIEVEVIDYPFDANKRVEYVQAVQHILQKFGEENKIVLLDPDTGIEPQKAKAEHVTVQEIKKLWAGLSSGDWLVLYQHRQRDQSWRDKTRNKFADVCGTEYVRTFLGPKIAGDVALFAVKKL